VASTIQARETIHTAARRWNEHQVVGALWSLNGDCHVLLRFDDRDAVRIDLDPKTKVAEVYKRLQVIRIISQRRCFVTHRIEWWIGRVPKLGDTLQQEWLATQPMLVQDLPIDPQEDVHVLRIRMVVTRPRRKT
jgi:hypothetical protein